MRYRTTAGFLFVGLMVIGVASASGQDWGRRSGSVPEAGACFYEDINYGGRHFCEDIGAEAAQMPRGMDRQVSSIRVFGDAVVTVFRGGAFQGQSRSFDSDASDLRRVNWNDRISSFRVASRGGWSGSRGEGGDKWGMAWGRPSAPRSGACFYRDVNYGGQYFCAPVGATAEQVPAGMNDQISSIRVFGNAEVTVYRDMNFQGQARNFDSDTNDLRAVGLNDRVSSFRVSRQGTWGRSYGDGGANWAMAWGRPSEPRSGVCFYRDINYGGEYFCAPVGATAEQVPLGMNDQISSIRVFGDAEVTVYRDASFQGRPRRFGSDQNDLRRAEMNDRISSFRVGTRGPYNR